MEKKRIEFVDVARGIAIISVMLGHLGNAGINRVVFTYHLPFFYLISGYFFDAKSDFVPFLKKKARQLLAPYYATCLLYLICSSCSQLLNGKAWSDDLRTRLIACLYAAGDNWPPPTNVSGIGAIWFLWALFWALIAFKLLLKLKPAVRMAIIAALFPLTVWSWRIYWLPLSIQAGGCALLFVYIGYLTRQLLPRLREARVPREVIAAGALIAMAMWLWFIHKFSAYWLVHCEIGDGMNDVVGSLCGCVVLVLASLFIDGRIRPLARPLAFYGHYSLLFLSIHFLELKCVKYRKLYHGFLKLTGLAKSDALHLVFLIAVKMILITFFMLILYRIPAVRRLYGYGPRKKDGDDPQNG